MTDVDLEVTTKGSKKVNNLTGAPTPPVHPATSAVALAFELEQLRDQLSDGQVTLAAKQLEIDNLRLTVKECTDAVNLAGVERDLAINEVAEIRGVLKSLAAILIKWDGWQPKHDPQYVQKQDPQPEVQS
jgi:hypothetical protein